MRKPILSLASAFLLALPLCYAAPQQESVAEAARKAREQKKTQPKPTKVYTNDDLAAGKGSVSVVGSAATTEEKSTSGEKAETKGGKGGKAGEKEAKPEEEKGEAYWRGRFAEARRKLGAAEKELDILQRELNLMEMQYYSDPNKALQEQYTRTGIDAHRKKITDKQKEVAQLRQALSDLEDELRRSGGDPGWARP